MPISTSLFTHSISMRDVVFLDPFHDGSHKVLTDLLHDHFSKMGYNVQKYTLKGKKWKWRMRCGSLYFASVVTNHSSPDGLTLFGTSMLNLCELIALRQDFARARKIIYFHENQLEYPNRHELERDIQFGWIQLITCLAADQVLFNSEYNLSSFLKAIPKILKLLPKDQIQGFGGDSLVQKIQEKSSVLYFPIRISLLCSSVKQEDAGDAPLRILWNHRWEWDKGPEEFFAAITELVSKNCTAFRLSILGQSFGEEPEIFTAAKASFENYIEHWGYIKNPENYYNVLRNCDVVVSTAVHEFFGVSVLEAAECGCFPLVPKRLSYPELFPTECLYNTHKQLAKKLKQFCSKPQYFRQAYKNKVSFGEILPRVRWENLQDQYEKVIG